MSIEVTAEGMRIVAGTDSWRKRTPDFG